MSDFIRHLNKLANSLEMTNEQKKIAENIINFIKENNNKVFKNTLLNNFDFDPIDRVFILRTLIEELDLIRVDSELYSLTKNGFSFVSFDEIENKEKLSAENEKIEFEKSKIDLKLNKWLLKTKWLPHFIAFISFVFAVYVYLDSKTDSKKLEQRIEVLETIIKDQKSETKI
jgi:predicted methyltransferase